MSRLSSPAISLRHLLDIQPCSLFHEERLIVAPAPGDILASADDIDDFRRRILACEGRFPFGTEEMIELGRVSFLRYPDSSSNRNMENVRSGYRIVRICILEKMMEGIETVHRGLIRNLFEESAMMETHLAALRTAMSEEGLRRCREKLGRNLEGIRADIDRLPRGMIKERFVGGVSKFYNILYLIDSMISPQSQR